MGDKSKELGKTEGTVQPTHPVTTPSPQSPGPRVILSAVVRQAELLGTLQEER